MREFPGHRRAADAMRRLLRPLLLLWVLAASACMSPPPDIPPWFDSFQRLPVRSVEVDGHRLAYLDQGHGHPVILIHGLGGSMWQWEYQQAPLSTTHRVVTLDLVGSGLSDKPALTYTPTELVTIFGKFMDALGIRRATLVGNSMGAGLAIGFALTHPERVERLVLIGGFPSRVRDSLTSPLLQQAVDTEVPPWLAAIGNWLSGRGPTIRILEEIVHDHSLLTPAVIERAYQNRQRPGAIPPLIALFRSLPHWESGFATRIGEVRQPTLIVWGKEDRIFPTSVGQTLSAIIAGARLEVIPDSGHLPQWERPEMVNPLLLDFLGP